MTNMGVRVAVPGTVAGGAVRPASLTYRTYVLAVLVLVYTFNFIDRQIVGILAVPIKAELGLTDSQLGMMGGLAFAIFYTLLGIPIARLADRISRTGIMAAALALWSLMTAACGLTHSFGQLFMARLGVGIGEAGGVAPAYSLICDYFPGPQRARALSVYSFGIPIGGATGIVLGGFISSLMSWRMAFIIVGLAGLCITPLFKFTVREPVRGGYDAAASGEASGTAGGGAAGGAISGATTGRVASGAEDGVAGGELGGAAEGAATVAVAGAAAAGGRLNGGPMTPPTTGTGAPSFLDVLRVLARRPSFWGLSLGAASASMMGYGLFFWMPSFLVRSFKLDLIHASLAYGGLVLVGGLAGIWLGGALADRFGTRHKASYALIPAIAFLATLPFYVAGVLSTELWVCGLVLLVPTALGLMWLGPVLTAVQHLVPATMRATASALFLFINNLIGIGLGTTLIGALSDSLHVRAGAESLRYAILAGTGFYVVASAFFLLASRRLARDWETQPHAE